MDSYFHITRYKYYMVFLVISLKVTADLVEIIVTSNSQRYIDMSQRYQGYRCCIYLCKIYKRTMSIRKAAYEFIQSVKIGIEFLLLHVATVPQYQRNSLLVRKIQIMQ